MGEVYIADRKLECYCDVHDVTSMSRPDPSWKYTDANGHVHCWFVDGELAREYHAGKHYTVPTVRYIVDVEDDGEYPEQGHHECHQCGEHIMPGTCADTTRKFISGMKHYRIDGLPVTREQFVDAYRELTGKELA